MPLLPEPDYQPPYLFRCAHAQTLYPTIFRKRPSSHPRRERLELSDGDFLDIDLHTSLHTATECLAIISHGLEGDSRKKYMLGMANALTGHGWDVICLNFRGCSGEMNRLPRLYHSGVTDDLHTVLHHGLHSGRYTTAALIGFSMGGNQTLKYLGEDPGNIPPQVRGAVVFSVPTELADSGRVMDRYSNRIYMEYFMRGLHRKVRLKSKRFPEIYTTRGLHFIRRFHPFDDRYTGPVHGFNNADDYYDKCSSKQYLKNIQVPTLLVQAKDDPFLSASCYPLREAAASAALHLEMPRYGGHVGFVPDCRSSSGQYWMEQRAVSFIKTIENRMKAGYYSQKLN